MGFRTGWRGAEGGCGSAHEVLALIALLGSDPPAGRLATGRGGRLADRREACNGGILQVGECRTAPARNHIIAGCRSEITSSQLRWLLGDHCPAIMVISSIMTRGL